MITAAKPIPGTPVDITFSDIVGHWAEDAIHYVVDGGLFNGATDTTFEPETNMTRGMFVTVLGRMAEAEGSGAEAAAQFADVDADEYYAPYVAWAAENNIVTGTEDDEFEPNMPISREQMAAILYRYTQFQQIETPVDSDAINAFADHANVSSYAADAMNWAVGSSLINGTDNNMLDPQGNATRAQDATILMRFSARTPQPDRGIPPKDGQQRLISCKTSRDWQHDSLSCCQSCFLNSISIGFLYVC